MPEREIRHRCIQTQGGASCETVNSFISTFSPPAAGHRWGIIRFLSSQFKVKPLPVVTTERRLHPYVLTAIPQTLPPKNENTVSGSQLMLVGTSCQHRQLTVWVGMGERWGPSFPKHTLPSHSQPPRWRPELELSVQTSFTGWAFIWYWGGEGPEGFCQIVKLSSKKRNKERNYLGCFWLWGLEREGRKTTSLPNSTLLLFKMCPKA